MTSQHAEVGIDPGLLKQQFVVLSLQHSFTDSHIVVSHSFLPHSFQKSRSPRQVICSPSRVTSKYSPFSTHQRQL